MITLTARMNIKGDNPLPFRIGSSELGGNGLFGVAVDVEAVFDRRNMLSIDNSIMALGDIQLPSFGIISNGGSLSFKDNHSRFLGYANAGLLKEGIQIAIYINDTQKKSKRIVGTYFSTDWEYDNDNKSVSVRFKDDMEEWQSIQVDALPLQFFQQFKGKALLQKAFSARKRHTAATAFKKRAIAQKLVHKRTCFYLFAEVFASGKDAFFGANSASNTCISVNCSPAVNE